MPFPSSEFLFLQLKLKGILQRKSLGQHFLSDPDTLARIADLAQLNRQTLALEIGPGAGTLTAQLGERAGGVLAIEFDERLRPLHEDVFSTFPSLAFHYADALQVDLHALARAQAATWDLPELVLTGNLPFQITSPLMFNQCGPGVPWRAIVVMVQKEVADRIASPPGRKAYGILTAKLECWWKVAERFEVGRLEFTPPPAVDASVLVLLPRPASEQPTAAEWPALSAFIDACFGQKRKTLVNSLLGSSLKLRGTGAGGPWPRETLQAALEAEGCPLDARAEALGVQPLRRLHKRLLAG